MKKKILILGVTGQDGSYLMDFLIKKNYEVHGLIRKSATGNTKNIDHVINDSKLFNKSFFVMPYAFIKEFVIREKKWLKNGGKFILPFPNFKVLNN